MRITRQLMSIEQAAGFAMAPSEDDMAEAFDPAPDDALRNGHVAAARKTASELSRVIVPAGEQHALRDLVSAWWPGKAHA
jgi:hypothetical protein